MFAGGIGISYHLSHVRELVDGYANGTVAARKVILVWAIRSGGMNLNKISRCKCYLMLTCLIRTSRLDQTMAD